MNTFLGIDAGTTSIKGALFNEKGEMLAVSRVEYSLSTPRPDWVELDPDLYWQALCQVVRDITARPGIDPRSIQSLCISSQGETLILLDAQNQALRPAIVWLDNRAASEAQWLEAQLGAEKIYTTTGQPEVTPTWPACKILWLKRNEQHVFEHAARILLLEDYLLYRLTGCFVTESALQTSSLLLNIRSLGWWDEMFNILGLQTRQLGELLHPGDPAGMVSGDIARQLGLPAEMLVVCGGMDQVLGAIGAGNTRPGMISESTGGALGILASLDRPIFDPGRRVPCHVHAARDLAGSPRYCLLPWGQTAGMALKWLRDVFFEPEVQQATEKGVDPYDLMTELAGRVPAGSEGLVTLPHLEGTACPEFNPHARGVFFGATLRHRRAHFVRSVMEAVAFMLRRNIELLQALGIAPGRICSMGGGARSRLWLQIKADVLQKPVTRLAVEESALLGAAMLGATAVKTYPDLEKATEQMVKYGETYHPNADLAKVYEATYEKYVALYERLEPLFMNHTGKS